MAKTRRAYTGGAASTTTSSNILSSGTTSFTITAYTGWPYGSDPFHVVVEPGTANEEKILVTRTGSTDTTVNVYATPSVAANRGADGTAAVAHSSGSTVFPVFTALDADEANELASTMTSKGDILTHDASSFERLAVGTNDYVLLADSGEATGLKWGQVDTGTLADGAVETAKLNDLAVTGGKLANATVDTKTASYTLVAGDRNKRIVMNNAGATTITVDDAIFSAGDVVWLHNIGAGTCTVTAGTATVNTAASLDLAQWEGGSLYFTSASSAIFFRGPAAGVGNANFTDTETGTYSSGGTNYKYLTFNSSGTITIDTAGLCDVLVVGGGGSGGVYGGGGGGAGGHLYATGAYLPVGTHTVTVGAGAAAVGSTQNNTGFPGLPGSPSQIHNYIVPGGGGGGSLVFSSVGSAFRATAQTGGSGGGGQSTGGGNTSIVGTGLSGIGNDGGLGSSSKGAGGGGGASAAGSAAASAVGGNGGDGLANSITGSSVTRAGGGGGGGATIGSGGSGGGGNGSGTIGVAAGSGTANTGSGGGGHSEPSSGSTSGAGGSGVVIIRVEV